MDVLSEVLRVVRLSGAVHFVGEFSEPWAFETSPPQMAAARLKVPEGSVTPFHVCIRGRCTVVSGKLPPIPIEADDVIVFPRGDQHVMAGESTAAAVVPIHKIYARPSAEQITVLKHGGGGDVSRFICGYLQSDQQFDPLLSSLPAVLCVRARGSTLWLETYDRAGCHAYAIEQPREMEWWLASVRFLIGETAAPGPGNRAVLARLAESLFVELLRWLFHHSERGHGWLAGLHDPQVGRVLSLLHALPNRAWTVDELAQEVGSSRATLAKRFLKLVGQSPIQYLAGWRMHLARDLLRESTLGIGEIAGRTGYESEAAFNRAFRRAVGSPPAAWRQNNVPGKPAKNEPRSARLSGAR